MRVRPAVLGDVEAIARIHVDSWRATYRGIMPDAVLDQLTYAGHAERWALRVTNPELVTLVAAAPAGSIAGFVLGGSERTGDPEFSAEVYAIYLDPQQTRRGIGTLLARGLALALADRGHRSLLVWVLDANPARHFYTALGARFVRSAVMTIGGAELPESAYGWNDLGDLIA